MKVLKIGIELELWLRNTKSSYFNMGDYEFEWKKYVIDREYYENQVELKAPLSSDIKWTIDWFKDFVLSSNRMMGGRIVMNPYVWTHIHMLVGDNDIGYTWFKQVRLRIVDYMYQKLFEYFNSLWQLSHIEREEIFRITRNHNILRYFDYETMGDMLRRNLIDFWHDYHSFKEWCWERPKYQPVIWSLANDNWKPHTLELRMIPNTFFLFNETPRIIEIINDIEALINLPQPSSNEEEELKSNIISYHKKLLSLVSSSNQSHYSSQINQYRAIINWQPLRF